MKRLYRYLPPFAGDYSGVGSALYELGGCCVFMMRQDVREIM